MANCWYCFAAPGFGLNSIANHGMDRWTAVPTTNVGFICPGMGPLAMPIIGCAVGGTVLLLVFGFDSKHKEWEPNWHARGRYVWHRESWRRWSAVHGYQGLRTFEFWSGVVCWDTHLWLYDSSECFTHRAYENCIRNGSSDEKPWEKPYQIRLTHLGEDIPECDVLLLSHPGTHVFLLLGHNGPLVLLFRGQFFPFKEQLPLKLRLGLGEHLQLPQSAS